MKKFPIMNFSDISLVQNKILCILVFCNSAYFFVNTYFFIFSVCTFYTSRHISPPFVFFCFAFFFCTSLISFCNFFTYLLVLFFTFFILLNYSNHTKILHLNSIHSSVYIGMRFHLYIFFTMFCVHSFFFVFLFNYAYLMSNCCFSTLIKKW